MLVGGGGDAREKGLGSLSVFFFHKARDGVVLLTEVDHRHRGCIATLSESGLR